MNWKKLIRAFITRFWSFCFNHPGASLAKQKKDNCQCSFSNILWCWRILSIPVLFPVIPRNAVVYDQRIVPSLADSFLKTQLARVGFYFKGLAVLSKINLKCYYFSIEKFRKKLQKEKKKGGEKGRDKNKCSIFKQSIKPWLHRKYWSAFHYTASS